MTRTRYAVAAVLVAIVAALAAAVLLTDRLSPVAAGPAASTSTTNLHRIDAIPTEQPTMPPAELTGTDAIPGLPAVGEDPATAPAPTTSSSSAPRPAPAPAPAPPVAVQPAPLPPVADPCFREDPECYETGTGEQLPEERIGRTVDLPDGRTCTVVAVDPAGVDVLDCIPAP